MSITLTAFLYTYVIAAIINTFVINSIFNPESLDDDVEDDIEISNKIYELRHIFIFTPIFNVLMVFIFVFALLLMVYYEIKGRYFDNFSD